MRVFDLNGVEVLTQPEPLNPKPETLSGEGLIKLKFDSNPKPETLNPNTETRNPKDECGDSVMGDVFGTCSKVGKDDSKKNEQL
jgi:hypothetical protein